MTEDLFEEIGFTIREKRVYLALLETGPTTAGKIIKRSGIPSSKIYETLDKLTKKGMITFIIKDHKRTYQANNPRLLLDFLEERKAKVQNELVPKLESMYHFTKQQTNVTVYEGRSGIIAVYEKALEKMKKGDTLYVLSAPSASNEILGSYLEYFHKRRIKKGVKMKVLYNQEAKKYGETRKNWPLTYVRYLDEKQAVPSAINMFLDYSIIFDYEKPVSCILIKSKNVSHNFTRYFETLWTISKE